MEVPRRPVSVRYPGRNSVRCVLCPLLRTGLPPYSSLQGVCSECTAPFTGEELYNLPPVFGAARNLENLQLAYPNAKDKIAAAARWEKDAHGVAPIMAHCVMAARKKAEEEKLHNLAAAYAYASRTHEAYDASLRRQGEAAGAPGAGWRLGGFAPLPARWEHSSLWNHTPGPSTSTARLLLFGGPPAPAPAPPQQPLLLEGPPRHNNPLEAAAGAPTTSSPGARGGDVGAPAPHHTPVVGAPADTPAEQQHDVETAPAAQALGHPSPGEGGEQDPAKRARCAAEEEVAHRMADEFFTALEDTAARAWGLFRRGKASDDCVEEDAKKMFHAGYQCHMVAMHALAAKHRAAKNRLPEGK